MENNPLYCLVKVSPEYREMTEKAIAEDEKFCKEVGLEMIEFLRAKYGK